MQIGDTLIEDGAAGVNTHIGTGQTFLRPSALIGALDGIGALWVPLAVSRAAKDESRMMRDIANSDLKGASGSVVSALLDRDDCPITVGTYGDCSALITHTAKAGVPGWSPFWAHALRAF